MAIGWVRSLQCKSKAFEDVYHSNPKHLIPSYSCRKSDVNERASNERPRSSKPKPKPKPRSEEKPDKSEPVLVRNIEPVSPVLKELPEGHPSRNVVEIIFHTRWGPKPFSGRIDMIFKVRNGSRTVTRFEEYRETVKARSRDESDMAAALEENARCVADGNEMMRFCCLGPSTTSAVCGGGAWGFPGGKGGGAWACTHSGSGGAHERSGGGRGKRAMLVCRVVAGRVSKRAGLELGFDLADSDGSLGFDSVSGEKGELIVFDPRAVLPCFLIIYRL